MATLRSLSELQETPSESLKISGFCAALEDDDQPASSYNLPVSGASGGVAADIDNCISSPSSGMCSNKVPKPLAYQGVRSRRFYRLEGEELTTARSLNRHVTELAGMRSFGNLNKNYFVPVRGRGHGGDHAAHR